MEISMKEKYSLSIEIFIILLLYVRFNISGNLLSDY